MDVFIPRHALLIGDSGETCKAENGVKRRRWDDGLPHSVRDDEPNCVGVVANLA